MNSVLPSRTHYPALDGLRGIAILLVVFFHNFGFINYFFFGWLGVDLFFVLSGFLITDILLKTRNTNKFLSRFYIRRILRIFPLYYFSLILLLVVIPRLNFTTIDFSYYIKNQWWYWTFLQNWFLVTHNYGNNTTALHHFWSLAVEEQYYLAWPWLILLIKKTKYLLLIMASLLVFIICARYYIWEYKISHFNYYGFFTFTRIDGLCIGSMLAILQFNNPNFLRRFSTIIIFGLALFNFIFYFFNRHNQFTLPYWAIVGYTTFAVIFALLLYEAISAKNRLLQFILEFPSLRFLGKVSFGFYVYHWPVYLLLYPYVSLWITKNSGQPNHNSKIVISIILTIIGFIISVISYYCFERYFLKLKKSFVS